MIKELRNELEPMNVRTSDITDKYPEYTWEDK
jgi:hypothetical protein